MSIPDDELPPIAAQDSFMNANLNATLSFNFLMGMYTMVYFGTLHLYYFKRGPIQQRRVVVSAISVLYIMCTCVFALDWYWLKYAVIDNGQTHTTMFDATVQSPPWVYVALDILQFGMFIVSDWILIWRCFYVWDRSLRIVCVPLFLLIAEIGLFIVIVVNAAHVPEFMTNATMATLENNLQCAGLFVSFAATVTTTFLIGYRIYSASHLDGIMSMGRRFEHIIKVLVESAAAYSLVILVNAVFAVIPFDLGSTLEIGSIYASLLLPMIGGMATTMVVARIAMANHDGTQRSTMTHISGLHFQTQQTGQNEGESREIRTSEDLPEAPAEADSHQILSQNIEKNALSYSV